MTDFPQLISQLETGTADPKMAFDGLNEAQKSRLQQAGCEIYTGKVRDMVRRGDALFMVHSDRLTAFDRMIGHVPQKGVLLTAIAAFWLKQLRESYPTHLVGCPHPRVLEVKPCDPVKVEVVVRGYLAGSMLRAYQEGRRLFCGIALPEGLKPYSPLPQPIITPTTKAAAFEHDEEISGSALIQRGVVTAPEWQAIQTAALKIFAAGGRRLLATGWLLVDTKYEFGRLADGSLLLIDEVHTPDSSRFWRQESYQERLARGATPEMFDKEIVRRQLAGLGFTGVGEVPPVPQQLLAQLLSAYLEIAGQLEVLPTVTDSSGDDIVDRILS